MQFGACPTSSDHEHTNAITSFDGFLAANPDSSLTEDEALPQDHDDQAADETQTQTAEEDEPMTVHFEVNCKFQPFSSSHGYQSH